MSSASSNRLHILYLMDEIKVRGGSEKHLFELASGMAAVGFRVTVFSLGDGDYAKDFRNHPAISYRCLNVTRIYDLKGISAILSMARFIQKERVDVIQTFHTASDLIGPIASRLSLRKTKVLSSRRDLGYTKNDRHVKMQRSVNKLVDAILANSTAVRKTVIERESFPAERVRTIFNGIDPGTFEFDGTSPQAQRWSIGAGEDDIVIGSVGNIRPVKGYDLLVEAAAIVLNKNPQVWFLQVGDGEMRNELEGRCRELGIGDRFIFLGATNDVAAFLKALDIYVQPSRSEGMSNAILEAMAAGLPVVATDVGGNQDLIEAGATGLLVPGEDSTALAEGLLYLAAQRDVGRKLGARARTRLLDRFHISSMLSHYKDLYLEITANDSTAKASH